MSLTYPYYTDVCSSCGWAPCRCVSTTYYNYPVYWWPSFWTWPQVCEHCYCKKAEFSMGHGPHMQCCKCGTTMAKKFLKQ